MSRAQNIVVLPRKSGRALWHGTLTVRMYAVLDAWLTLPEAQDAAQVGDYVLCEGRLTGQRAVVVDKERVRAGVVSSQGVRPAVAGLSVS